MCILLNYVNDDSKTSSQALLLLLLLSSIDTFSCLGRLIDLKKKIDVRISWPTI